MAQFIVITFFTIICIFHISSSFDISNNKYRFLTNNEWSQIRSILNHPKVTKDMKEKINNEIFTRYSKWSKNQAVRFKRKNYYNCKHISVNELSIYAQNGLWKAIQNYNASFPFQKYASTYIHGSLCIGLTKLQPISLLPEHLRRKGEWRRNNKEQFFHMTNPSFVGDDDWKIENNQKNTSDPFDEIIQKNDYDTIWEIVDKLDPFSKAVFKYKYGYRFDDEYSNAKIAELFGCSQESVRKSVNKTKEFIQQSIQERNKFMRTNRRIEE